jgi:hypothetical protein
MRTFTVPWPIGIKCPDELISIVTTYPKPTIEDLIDEGIYQNYHDFRITAEDQTLYQGKYS